VLDEVKRALDRPYFARRVNAADRAAYIALLRREAIVMRARAKIGRVATHPEDDAVLGAALDGDARYLVTGDRALRDLGAFRGIAIVSPGDFIEIAGSEIGAEI
jgi:predicted nucleic acid-binding protein